MDTLSTPRAQDSQEPSSELPQQANASPLHYWQYLRLDMLLASNQPQTASQDEDLFISVHHLCELSFRQMITDLERALEALREALRVPADGVIDTTQEACYFLTRVTMLYEVVNSSVPVLNTLRAFAEFRSSLGPSSGFQSFQFRRLEIMSGVRSAYWERATASPQRQPQAAELAFQRRYGAEVEACLRRYHSHSLSAYFVQLCERAPGASQAERLQALSAHAHAGPLLQLLGMYEKLQLSFHRLHRQLTIQQLERVGASTGTGGTGFQEYLLKYEREHAPLFKGL